MQISKHYPSTLAAYEAIDDNESQLFGGKREQCHYPLLKAVFTAKVDVLLPVLYYTCTDYQIGAVFDRGKMLDSECLQTLIKGKFLLEHSICRLLAELPDELGDIGCIANKSCTKKARITGLGEYICWCDLKEYEGRELVESCLQGACEDCAKLLGDGVNFKRQQIWDRVPWFFGFPEWDVLRRKLEEIC